MLAEYISYAKDCLGNQMLEFNIQDYADYDEMLQALQDQEINVSFLCRQKSDFAGKKRICTYRYSMDLQSDGGD